NRILFGGARALEHVIDDRALAARIGAVARMADAEAQAPEFRSQVLDDAADTVVPGAAAVELQLRAARRQIELVVSHEHVLGRNLVEVDGCADGLAAQVHVRHRLQQPDAAPSEANLRALALQLALARERAAMFAGEQVDEPEAGVVACRLVLGSGVAEADDEIDLSAHDGGPRMQRPPKWRPCMSLC